MILLTTHIDTPVNPLDKGDLWKSIPVYHPSPYRLLFVYLFIGGVQAIRGLRLVLKVKNQLGLGTGPTATEPGNFDAG